MNAVLALLLDAYREMNAKRMFWIVLILSGVMVAAFAGVGLTPTGVTIFGWQAPMDFGTNFYTPATFYKLMFVTLGIHLWIAWAAMILAIISTSGIFPDFLASGSVDLYLARPIGRLRLFLVKYACGLLFVALQVGVFSVASFLVIGLRGGVWEPGLLLAIPLAVLMFSYLFSVCALVGVVTRSTITALLMTLLFWMFMGGLQTSEQAILGQKLEDERNAAMLDRQIARVEAQLAAPPTTAPDRPRTAPSQNGSSASLLGSWTEGILALVGPAPRTGRQDLQDRLAELKRERAQITGAFDQAHHIIYLIETPLPKTSETISLIQRKLLSSANLPGANAPDDSADAQPSFRARRRERQRLQASVEEQLGERPVSWVIGTSLGFEAVVVAMGAWIFCRRDY